MQDNYEINQQVNLQSSGPRELSFEEIQAVSGGGVWRLVAKIAITIITALIPSGSGDSTNKNNQ